MNTKLFLFIVLFLSGTVVEINAQIVKGLVKSKAGVATNRASQDANKEVDSRINNAVDKQFNKLIGKKNKQSADSSAKASENAESDKGTSEPQDQSSSKSAKDDAMSKAIMGRMGINMVRPANMKDFYEYTGNIKMDVETWNEDGESQGPVAYTTQYSEKNNSFAMEFKDKEKGHSTMIFDYENQLMIVLADDGKDKNGFASPLGAYASDSVSTSRDTVAEKTEVQNTGNYSGFKKTGNSKTIAGYKSDEYYFENEEDKVSYWMTTDLPAELWAKMYTSNAFTSLYTGQTSGFVMESDHQLKTSKARSYMIVKEVNQNQPASVSTVGYTIMTMNAPPASPGNKEKGGEK